MREPQRRRMKRLSGKGRDGLGRGVAQRRFRQLPPPAINRIAHKPVADMGGMDADLVGAAGFQPAFNQAGHGRSDRFTRFLAITLNDLVIRDGVLASLATFFQHSHFFTVMARPSELGFDGWSG